MTYPRITPAADPDAVEEPALGTVLTRYPNLSGALVTVAVADYPRGTATISPSPTLNRVGECGGCGELYGTAERGNKEEDVRRWAQGHSETCRALPPATCGPDYATLAHTYAEKAVRHLEALRGSRIPAVELTEAPHTAQLYMRAAELYARLATH